MYGTQLSVSSKMVHTNSKKQVTAAMSANSGFLLDMSDLIQNGSTVSRTCRLDSQNLRNLS